MRKFFSIILIMIAIFILLDGSSADRDEPEEAQPVVVNHHVNEGFYQGTIVTEDGQCYEGLIRVLFDGDRIRLYCEEMQPSNFNKLF